MKIERDAQDMADNLGVKIFQADIIYHLFDKFTAYREELKARKREEFKSIAVFPCKLKVSVDLTGDRERSQVIVKNPWENCRQIEPINGIHVLPANI